MVFLRQLHKSKGVKDMWKLRVVVFGYADVNGEREFVQTETEYKFKDMREAGAFIENIQKCAERIPKFELKFEEERRTL